MTTKTTNTKNEERLGVNLQREDKGLISLRSLLNKLARKDLNGRLTFSCFHYFLLRCKHAHRGEKARLVCKTIQHDQCFTLKQVRYYFSTSFSIKLIKACIHHGNIKTSHNFQRHAKKRFYYDTYKIRVLQNETQQKKRHINFRFL